MIRRRHLSVLQAAVASYHLTIGYLLLASEAAGKVTNTHLFEFEYAGLMLIAASTISIVGGLSTSESRMFKWLMSPQQAILTVAALGSLVAIVQGQYPDGYTPADPHVFIAVDQIIYPILALAHCMELYRIDKWEKIMESMINVVPRG